MLYQEGIETLKGREGYVLVQHLKLALQLEIPEIRDA